MIWMLKSIPRPSRITPNIEVIRLRLPTAITAKPVVQIIPISKLTPASNGEVHILNDRINIRIIRTNAIKEVIFISLDIVLVSSTPTAIKPAIPTSLMPGYFSAVLLIISSTLLINSVDLSTSSIVNFGNAVTIIISFLGDIMYSSPRSILSTAPFAFSTLTLLLLM